MASGSQIPPSKVASGWRPFRAAVLRGLEVVAPPLLTLVILVWMVRTVDYYILEPVLTTTGDILARELADIRTELPDGQATADPTVFVVGEKEFKQLESGQFIPLSV